MTGEQNSPGGISHGDRVLTMLVDPEPTTLVAVTNCADPTMLVSAKVSEGLLSYDFDLNPQPQLATGWTIADDGLGITFHLRQDVKWHDGLPFTSADVAFSIGLLKQVHPRGRSTFANVAEVATPDPFTAIVRLSSPAPFLLTALAGTETPMVPKHRYDGVSPQASPNGAAPVGTGPFVFREWVRGSHAIYDRNPSYWDIPKPYVDRILVRFIEDADEALAAIEDGTIDLAPGTPVPVTKLGRLEASPKLVFETRGYEYTNQVVRLEFNLDHPILGRYEVRRGFAHAIDRQILVAKAWLGYAKVALGPISPDLKLFSAPDLAVPPVDLSEANRWLDAAGFPRDANGFRFQLPLDYVPAGEGYQRTAEFIAQALAEIGVAVEVRAQDFSSYIKRIYTDRDFAFTVGRANNMFDPSVGVQRIYWSQNFRTGVPFSNGSHYASQEADRLLEAAAVEGNPVKRQELFREFQTLVVKDMPDLTLLAPAQITIANKRVHNHTVTADGPNGNLADLRLDP